MLNASFNTGFAADFEASKKPVSRSLWEVDVPTGNPSIRISEPKALN
jgi:hypothetical protein